MGVRVNEWKGAWWLFIHHQGRRKRKRVGVGRGGKKAAELAAIQIRARLASGDSSLLQQQPLASKFAALAEEWLVKYPALHAISPGTLDSYRSFTRMHLIPHFGEMPVTAITADKIEDFIEAKRGPGGSVRRTGKALSDSSLRVGLLPLRLILQRAVRMKLISANPLKEVDWRGLPHIDNVDPFTLAELRALLTAADELDRDIAAMLHLWVQSGMRAGEVCGLQWQDVDLGQGAVLVRRTFSRHRLGPTKTRRDRTVSVLHPVAEDTTDWRPGVTPDSRLVLDNLRGLTVRSLEPDAFVFGKGRAPLSSTELHRRWRRVVAKAKIRYRPPEQLRHTFASTMLSRNAPLLYVQQQGGWRSATVLLKSYSRWMPQGASPNATQTPPARLVTRLQSAPNAH